MGKNVIISTLPNISQNYLPKVNTSNIFANSLVYDDGNSVLINTTTASAFRLDVNGTARTGALTLTGALNGTSATFSKSSSSGSGNDFPRLQVENTLATQGDGTTTFNFADIRIASGNSSVQMFLATTYAAGTWAPAGIINVSTNHDLQIKTNNTTRLTIANTGAATFSSSVSAGGYITGQGTNPGGLGGSRFVIDHFNGNMRIFSYGDNTSTNGGFTFNSQRSDGTNSINFLSFATSGAATFSSTIDAGGDITVSKSGDSGINVNSTTTNGTAVTRYKTTAAGNLWATGINITNSDSRWEVYNFTLGASPFRLSNSTGAATFSSSVQLSTLVSAPSYGSGSTGLNIGYMNFQNVIGIQACYANNIYYDGANWKSISSSVPWAAAVRLQAGHIDFHTASVSSSGQTMSNWDTTDLKMRITSGGNVLMGKTSTGQVLVNGFEFNPSSNYISTCSSVAGDTATYVANTASAGTRYLIRFYGTSAEVGKITHDGTNTTYATTSDYRLKEDLQEVKGLEKVLSIKTYDFKWKNSENRMDGVIAHELQEILGYAVVGEKDGIDMQGVDYSKLTPILVKAIQEQQAQIEEQKADIESLKALINK